MFSIFKRKPNANEKRAQIEAFYARLKACEEALKTIEFDNQFKYKLSVENNGIINGKRSMALLCWRRLADSRSGKYISVSNHSVLPETQTVDDLIKTVFKCVGQFEAHEFAESFTVKGRHAYFPHGEAEGYALFGQGEALNNRMLELWNDVTQDRSDLEIAFRYLGLAYANSMPIRNLIKVLKAFDTIGTNLIEYITLQAFRVSNRIQNALRVASFVPEYLRVIHAMPSIKTENSAKVDSQSNR